jgi:putative MFS transporter
MVLIGGDIAGAYIVTSFLAAALEPRFSWRIMWLIGLPTGVLFIALNRWIPESPRFLLSTGRTAEAEAVMARFGARLVPDDEVPAPAEAAARFGQLFHRPLAGLTAGVALFGIGWGLVSNGFLLWLPTNLRGLGMGVGAADRLLADSALIGLPAVVVVALLYGFWSSHRTMIICAVVNAATLAAFAILGQRTAAHPTLLHVLIVLLLVSTAAMLATLIPYSSEVYPTLIRARGTGLAGMSARAGGLLGVGLVVAGITPPSLTGAALLGIIPVTLAALTIGRYGTETRHRPLEDITATEPAARRVPMGA